MDFESANASDSIWISFEAKSDEDPGKALPLRDVRQANTRLRQMAADRGVALPAVSASVIIAPGTEVVDEAIPVAESHVYLATPDPLLELAADIAAAWDMMLGQAERLQTDALQRLVRRTPRDYNVLPSQVFDRLTIKPLSG